MRLTIITITLALSALTACGPLTATPLRPAHTVDRSEAVVPAGGECAPAREGECSVTPNPPPTPNICQPGESEGGLPC